MEKIKKQPLAEEWLRENIQALQNYNKRVEKYGVFSDGLRRFSEKFIKENL